MKIPTFLKPIWLAMIVFFVAALPAFSVDLTIEYLEGYLDEKDGDEWLELFIGDEIPDTATTKLYEESIAELTAPGIKLTLTKEADPVRIRCVGTLLSGSRDPPAALP